MASSPTAPPMEEVKNDKDQAQARKEDKDGDDNDKNNDSMFECNICLDTAKDAVVRYLFIFFLFICLHSHTLCLVRYRNTQR